MRSRVGVLLSVAAVFGLPGCGEGGPKLVPVSGTVTFNGKPLKDAVVSFLPDDSNKGALPGEDSTGPEGNYKAMTRGRSGLAPGKYKVVVTKSMVDPAKIPSSFKDDPYMAKLAVEGPEPAAQGASSGSKPTEITQEFQREVEPGGGVLDFDVKGEGSK